MVVDIAVIYCSSFDNVRNKWPVKSMSWRCGCENAIRQLVAARIVCNSCQ